MLGKRSRPVIGKLPDLAIPDLIITSPKSPLDFKFRSPRSNNGFKNCVAGVGLGIVAALEKISGDHADSQTPAKFVLGSLNLNRSEPIPIGSANKTSSSKNKNSVDDEFCEDYTCVISHRGPNNKPITRVFFDGDEFSGDGGGWRFSGERYGSPAVVEEVAPAYPTSSFLSSCYLCRKTLHGRDIFMYRGEKAFCSSECRYKQIVSDERKEKCRSEASRPTAADMSASPYSGGQLFSTGIIAA